MNRIRLLAIGTMLLFALSIVAQQPTATTSGPAKDVSGGDGMPTVESQLKVLTEKLDLSEEQKANIQPILQELHVATQKLILDESLSHEERLAQVRPHRYKADKQIREFLSDDQKKKFDLYLQGPHPEMHGNLSGATPPPARAPQN